MLFYLLKFIYRVIIINLNWNKNIEKKSLLEIIKKNFYF